MSPALPRSLGGVPLRRAAPTLVVLTCPPLFLAHRELAACGTPLGCSSVAVAGYAAAALLGVPAAALLARAVAAGRAPAWLAPRADDVTLAVLATVVVAVDGYLLAALAGAVPPVADRLLAPVGLLLALPLALVQVLVVAAGAVAGEPSVAVQLPAVAVGVALSAAWWYALGAGASRLVARVNEPRD